MIYDQENYLDAFKELGLSCLSTSNKHTYIYKKNILLLIMDHPENTVRFLYRNFSENSS